MVWRVCRRRWPIALLVAVLAVAAVAGLDLPSAEDLRSTCSIVVETMAPQVLQGVKDVVELGTGSFWANREFYETQFRIIRSTEVMQRVIEKLNLQRDPAFVAAGDEAQSTRHGRSPSRAAPDRKPQRLAHREHHGFRSRPGAGGPDRQYHRRHVHRVQPRLQAGGGAVGDRLAGQEGQALRKKLEQSELALFEFRKKKNLLAVGLDDKQSMTSKNLETINLKLSEITIKRAEAGGRPKS